MADPYKAALDKAYWREIAIYKWAERQGVLTQDERSNAVGRLWHAYWGRSGLCPLK